MKTLICREPRAVKSKELKRRFFVLSFEIRTNYHLETKSDTFFVANYSRIIPLGETDVGGGDTVNSIKTRDRQGYVTAINLIIFHRESVYFHRACVYAVYVYIYARRENLVDI